MLTLGAMQPPSLRRAAFFAAAALLCASSAALAQPPRSEESPAARPVPPSATAQSYTAELVAAGGIELEPVEAELRGFDGERFELWRVRVAHG